MLKDPAGGHRVLPLPVLSQALGAGHWLLTMLISARAALAGPKIKKASAQARMAWLGRYLSRYRAASRTAEPPVGGSYDYNVRTQSTSLPQTNNLIKND
jgi:hypothetical protein